MRRHLQTYKLTNVVGRTSKGKYQIIKFSTKVDNVQRDKNKKRYNIFLKQVKIVTDQLRIAFLRNMARRGSCQMSANKDSRNSLRLFQVMQRN